MRQRVFGLACILSAFAVLATASFGQGIPTLPSESIVPKSVPLIATDIPKADIDLLLKNADIHPRAIDQPLRVVDVGKYNVEVSIVHRTVGDVKNPGDPVIGPYHDHITEVYIMLAGTGVLTTGTMTEAKQHPGYSITSGDGGNGTASKNDYSRTLHAGDVVIIPPDVVHVWSQITEPVTYLTVRPDPDRVLPAGYVSPLLLKNQPEPAKLPASGK